MFGKAVNRFFILVSIVPLRVIVGVFLFDHAPFLVVKKLKVRIHVLQPLVLVYLIN